ncbi:TonB-dependent receptor [Pedobacter nutrimenti]|uniref:Outer membrane receptor protein involved in Fe transport n=1 Tax=Pedobacter nutrimenti TaxID=1241337 RepID=A0A318U7A7_9SPHI|nr:TonB-dependent receptor [Pedobacter nutrimenti]PYF68412.1 outer membrane receptor protein involved in Fe transport [Pedobacter nutrimenti]
MINLFLKTKSILRISVLLVFWSVLFAISAEKSFAQNAKNIKGVINDNSGTPQPFVTLVLLNTLQQRVVGRTLSDEHGNFVFEPPGQGNYEILASAMGYERYKSPGFSIRSDDQVLPEIKIVLQSAEGTLLHTVNIISRKSVVERKADRTIVNVDAMLTATGGNALEVLEQSPGIVVDNDQIILKGKPNVTIFIDNKPSYLQGNELSDYLKSLPAALLDKVEIMSNPPAQYEAAGNGGIINIKLKKGKMTGFNGNLLSEATQGKYSRRWQSLNFNYRTGRFNLFGNASQYTGSGFSEFNSSRAYPLNNNSSLQGITQKSTQIAPGNRIFGKIGLDFFVSPKTTFGMLFSYLNRKSEHRTSILSRQVYEHVPDTLILSDNQDQNRGNNLSFNLNMQHNYDTIGRAWTADFDLIRYGVNYRLDNHSYSQNAAGQALKGTHEYFEGLLPSVIRIYTFKTDYVLPFNKNSKLETGLKSALIDDDNSSTYNRTIDQVVWPAYDRSGQFNYQEYIQALYLNYSFNLKKISFQMGLRGEYTLSKGKQGQFGLPPDSSFSRHYLNLFPTVFVSYKMDTSENHVLNLSFGKRIERPNYQNLNPFAAPRDRYNYDIGNPYLKPQFSYNYEASYVFKKAFTFSVFYNHLKDGIDEVISVQNDVFFHCLDNIGKKNMKGFSLDGSLKITEWWTLNPNLIFTNTRYQTILDGQPLLSKGSNWSLSLGQQFNWKDGWTAEIMSNYNSAQVYAQFVQKENWYVHAGVGKKVFNNRGSVKLNARDVFYTRVDRQDFTGIHGISGYSSRKWDTRNITLALAYRFDKGKRTTFRARNPKNQESSRLGEL